MRLLQAVLQMPPAKLDEALDDLVRAGIVAAAAWRPTSSTRSTMR